MKTVAQVFVCVLIGVAGCGAAVLLGYFGIGGLGVSDFEGQRSTLAAFVFGPIGAIAGLAGGGWAARRMFHAPTNPGSVAGLVGLGVVAVGALGAIGVLVSTLFGEPRWTNGAPPRLLFEIRAAGDLAAGGDERRWRVNLDTPYNQMPATLASPILKDGDALVVSGEVELYYRTAKRTLVLDFGEGRSHVYDLRAPATPKASTTWSEWTRVSRVFELGTGTVARPARR